MQLDGEYSSCIIQLDGEYSSCIMQLDGAADNCLEHHVHVDGAAG